MKPWADELNIDTVNAQFLKVAGHGISVPDGFSKTYGAKNAENGTLNPKSLRITETNNLVSQIEGGGVISEVVEDSQQLTEASGDFRGMINDFAKAWSKKRAEIQKTNPDAGKQLHKIGSELGNKFREALKILKSV